MDYSVIVTLPVRYCLTDTYPATLDHMGTGEAIADLRDSEDGELIKFYDTEESREYADLIVGLLRSGGYSLEVDRVEE